MAPDTLVHGHEAPTPSLPGSSITLSPAAHALVIYVWTIPTIRQRIIIELFAQQKDLVNLMLTSRETFDFAAAVQYESLHMDKMDKLLARVEDAARYQTYACALRETQAKDFPTNFGIILNRYPRLTRFVATVSDKVFDFHRDAIGRVYWAELAEPHFVKDLFRTDAHPLPPLPKSFPARWNTQRKLYIVLSSGVLVPDQPALQKLRLCQLADMRRREEGCLGYDVEGLVLSAPIHSVMPLGHMVRLPHIWVVQIVLARSAFVSEGLTTVLHVLKGFALEVTLCFEPGDVMTKTMPRLRDYQALGRWLVGASYSLPNFEQLCLEVSNDDPDVEDDRFKMDIDGDEQEWVPVEWDDDTMDESSHVFSLRIRSQGVIPLNKMPCFHKLAQILLLLGGASCDYQLSVWPEPDLSPGGSVFVRPITTSDETARMIAQGAKMTEMLNVEVRTLVEKARRARSPGWRKGSQLLAGRGR